MKSRRQLLGIFLALSLAVAGGAIAGCGPHVASKAGVPARKATPVEKALAYNAGLAETNKTIAQIVMDANSQNPPLISTENANQILTVQSRVADFDRQLTPLIMDAGTASANSAKIQTLLNEIKIATQGVQGDLGIKDTATRQKVTNAIGQISSFADLTLSALVQAGVLK